MGRGSSFTFAVVSNALHLSAHTACSWDKNRLLVGGLPHPREVPALAAGLPVMGMRLKTYATEKSQKEKQGFVCCPTKSSDGLINIRGTREAILSKLRNYWVFRSIKQRMC